MDQQQIWLEDARYQTVLRATHTIAFDFNPRTREQHVSPGISACLAGNYDGRPLSQVMLEDGVIHPDDRKAGIALLGQAQGGRISGNELTLRLKTPSGDYHWFRLGLYPHEERGETIYVGVFTDVDGETRQHEALRYWAEYDALTGIYNKRTFYDRTETLLCENPGVPHCLFRLDIDQFKIVNELYSVSEGDRMLRYLAEILKDEARPHETYARLYSDVFCMCVQRDEEETASLIRTIERRLEEYPVDFQIVLSVGVVRIPHYDGQPANILCDRAAMAQRTIKGNFVHLFAFYEDAMSETLNREHYITGCMRRALEEGQFTIYLQPKYDIRTGGVIGAEALARWIHPQEGMIPPGDFIPLFERNGFILRLDEYIWDLTCKTMHGWMDRGIPPIPISVNVSRVHMHDMDFCDKLCALSKKYRLPPHLLELEITESACTENPRVLYNVMDRLQELGFTFSMDDFGSGYSSLNALKDIPVDTIKIDLNFLKEARRGQAAGRNILRGAIRLVQGMGLPIIAEGVETEEQADFLLSAGCTRAQGFYYARPMPLPDFERILLATPPAPSGA